MTTNTPNLSLVLYDNGADASLTFNAFRTDIAGSAVTSNFYKIDTAVGTNTTNIGTHTSQIASLMNGKTAVLVSAIRSSPGVYAKTGLTEVVSYVTGMSIILKLDITSTGATTLNINSLGAKSVMKVNTAGTHVDITGGELVAGKYYLFMYDGTRFVWVGATVADQLYIAGTSGNVVTVNSDNTLLGTTTQSLLVSQTINSATDKAIPVDADLFGIVDSAASNILKKLSWANIKSTLNTYFSTLFTPISTTIPNDGWISDSSTWSVRSQAYTNDPAIGQSIVLNMTDTSKFAVGAGVIVSSSAGAEMAIVMSLVTNTSITVSYLALNHTTTSPVVIAFAFGTSVDKTATIKKGDLVKFTQSTVKYLVVYSVSSTVITFIPTSDFLLTTGAISLTYYSHLHNPMGAPNYFASIPYFVGLTTPVIAANGLKAGYSNLGGGIISYSGRIGITSWASQTGSIIIVPVCPMVFKDFRTWGAGAYYRTGTSTQQGSHVLQMLDANNIVFADNAAANPIAWEASAAVVLTWQIAYDT